MNGLVNARRSRRRTASEAAGGAGQPIVLLVSVLLGFESSMYSAVTPVLPHYAHTLHASKPAVGVLTASYAAGIVPGSLLGAWVAARAGVRRATLTGLLLFAASIIAFGFATNIVALDALRFIQGTGCGFIWGGGLTWVIAFAPRERRGAVLGTVIAAAIFGTLVGPILGTLAVAVGTAPVFTAVGLVAFGLAGWTLRMPEPAPGWQGDTTGTPLRTLVGTPRILFGSWLILLEAATVGATGTLIPLRLAHFGASGLVVGATFLVAALISTQVSTPIGRLVDRRGARLPLCVGLTLTAVLMILLPIPHSAAGLAILATVALGGPLTLYTVPAMSLMTNASEQVGVPIVMATMLLNLAWALGETLGAPAAANIAQATSDTVPLLMLSAIMALTLIPIVRGRLGVAAAPAAVPAECAADGRPASLPRERAQAGTG